MRIALSFFFSISRITRRHRISSVRWLAATLSLLTLSILGLTPVSADASLPVLGRNGSVVTSVATAPGDGFWVQLDRLTWDGSGATLGLEGAPGFESVDKRGSIAAVPGRNGYWVVTDEGQIFDRGDAPHLCDGLLSNCSGFPKEPGFPSMIVGGMDSR
jgi:hypothetical protein